MNNQPNEEQKVQQTEEAVPVAQTAEVQQAAPTADAVPQTEPVEAQQPVQAQQPTYQQPTQVQQPTYQQPTQAQQPAYQQPTQAQQPTYQQPTQAQQGYYQYTPVNPAQVNNNANTTSGFSIAGFVLGIIGIFTCCFIVPSVLAVIFSIIGLCQKGKNKGFAVAGLVMGIIGLFMGLSVYANGFYYDYDTDFEQIYYFISSVM